MKIGAGKTLKLIEFKEYISSILVLAEYLLPMTLDLDGGAERMMTSRGERARSVLEDWNETTRSTRYIGYCVNKGHIEWTNESSSTESFSVSMSISVLARRILASHFDEVLMT